jgi:hypothetical protein
MSGATPFLRNWKMCGQMRAWLIGAAMSAAAALPASAGQQFNSHTNQWETTAPGSTLQFNDVTQSWEYAPPGAKPVINPMTNKWELAPPGAVPTFNAESNSWSMQPPGAQLEFNPYTGKNEYPN